MSDTQPPDAIRPDLIPHIAYLPAPEQAEVVRALDYASTAHDGQTRMSGEPYVWHAISTAIELARMQMDRITLTAGLLHDVPEDTERTEADLRQEFGEDVARLVAGVTKLGKVRLRSKEEQQARNLRKMFLAMSEDVRVIIIKLCDRLHNMRTIDALPRKKQKGIATETLEIYAPLANRLGMGELRWQLEDLALKCLNPKVYNYIETHLRETHGERQQKVDAFIDRLEQDLTKNNIIARVYGRPKHLYSIYRNVYVKKKETNISNVLDSLGMRIVLQDVKDCYQALGLVHRIWRPIVGRFKDYIAIPKANGYQSLHTGVICEDGSRLEIQIRTEDMDYTSEFGMAAHWVYKGDTTEFDQGVQERMNWIHQLIEWQKEFRTAFDFVESLKLDLFQDQIFVFSPRGDVIDLPREATSIDYAYTVHTELGHSAIGAKVNGRMVPLNHRLKSGDIIEILRSSQKRGPSRDWLEFVKTNSAKGKIRAWFKKQQHHENVISGKRRVESELQRLHRMPLDDIPKKDLEKVRDKFTYDKTEELWAAVGYGALTPGQVVGKLQKLLFTREETKLEIPPTLRDTRGLIKPKVKIKGVGDLMVKIAPCCHPIPGDNIMGYITRGRGITIHRMSCTNIQTEKKNEPERVIPLDWEQEISDDYEVSLFIRGRDRMGIAKDLITTLADQNVSILSFDGKSDTVKDTFTVALSIKVENFDHLSNVLRALDAMSDLISVERR